MKILQVAKYPPSNRGGIEKLTNQLTTDLNTKGRRIDILCFEENTKTKIDVFLSHTVYKCRSLFKIFSTSISFHNIYFFNKLQKSYDFIYLHLPNPLVAAYILFAKDKGSKIFVHHHADICSKKLYFLYKPLEENVLKAALKIITTSQSLANTAPLKKYKNKVNVIPLYLDANDFGSKFTSEQKRVVQEASSGEKFVLFVGRLVKYKRLDLLLKAFKNIKCDKTKLILIGDGKEYGNIIKESLKLEIDKRIMILRNIDDDTKRCFYQNAIYTVLPSTSSEEAFGYVQLESMAMNTPVVSFDIENSGVGEINKNNHSGLVLKISKDEEENVTNLSKAMNKLMFDRKLRDALSEGAYQRSKEFTKEENLGKYLKIFREFE